MTERTDHAATFSLIFVNYRSIFRLSQSLRSLRSIRKSFPSIEIIVVNQDTSERRIAKEWSDLEGFRLLQRENLGFASGANAGAAIASGRYLGFLNPDTLYSSGDFQAIEALFASDERLGIVGATLCDAAGEQERWSFGRELTLLRLFLWNIFPANIFCGTTRIDWVSGGALFVRRSVFETLRGFDAAFFLYFEDMDICVRARMAGFSIQSTPGLRLFHRGGVSFSSRRIQKEWHRESQRLYFAKHRPFWEQWILSLLTIRKYLSQISPYEERDKKLFILVD